MKKKKFEGARQQIEKEKFYGNKISRSVMWRDGQRFAEENSDALVEAQRERSVLNMKRHFIKRGWRWPPTKHPVVTVVHLLNGYYGKEVCKHTPKDEMEKLIDNKDA